MLGVVVGLQLQILGAGLERGRQRVRATARHGAICLEHQVVPAAQVRVRSAGIRHFSEMDR